MALVVMASGLVFTCAACKKKKAPRSNPDVSVGENFYPEVVFTIKDMDGNSIDESVFSLHTLTIINFWEPWCGPCVNEMPELEKLYENYKNKGFYIIGVYSSTNMKSEVKDIMKQAHTSYPIATYDSAFDRFQSGSVPTTIFMPAFLASGSPPSSLCIILPYFPVLCESSSSRWTSRRIYFRSG